MHKRNVLEIMNGPVGYIDEHIFRRGTIKETWKQIESESDKWFNPDFEKFLNKEIAPEPESKPI
jgi:hypothetical protein